jgi:hypothetical protein
MREEKGPPATVSEAARIWFWSEDTVRRKCDAGALVTIRLASGLRLIDRDSLERMAKVRRQS